MNKYVLISGHKDFLQSALKHVHNGEIKNTPIEKTTPRLIGKKINPEFKTVVVGLLPKYIWEDIPGKPGFYKHKMLPVTAVLCNDTTDIYW